MSRPEEKLPKNDLKDDKIMKEFAECIAMSLKEEKEVIHEAFEGYSHGLRAHVCQNVQAFQNRFVKGYHILLERLPFVCGENDESNE